VDEHAWLIERFEEDRTRLRAVAYRMLGSLSEADDAVQDAWLRLSRADSSLVDNLDGWLTTVVSRVCLDKLRARTLRREEPEGLGVHLPEPIISLRDQIDPEQQVLLAEGVGLALLVVLETLTPAERLAFVLHDLFAVPYEEIAPIVQRSPASARQLASRARRRVQGAEPPDADPGRQRRIVAAFLAAARDGDLAGLLAALDPDVVLRADEATVRMGAAAEVRGATEVAGTFSGRAKAAQPALVDGEAGAVWVAGNRPRVVFTFVLDGDTITEIGMHSDEGRLAAFELAYDG
jgi:RNA polymerase sigma-70 factor (ECF subfamily)